MSAVQAITSRYSSAAIPTLPLKLKLKQTKHRMSLLALPWPSWTAGVAEVTCLKVSLKLVGESLKTTYNIWHEFWNRNMSGEVLQSFVGMSKLSGHLWNFIGPSFLWILWNRNACWVFVVLYLNTGFHSPIFPTSWFQQFVATARFQPKSFTRSTAAAGPLTHWIQNVNK